MKIIDIAICTDNKDPKGIGRIRAKSYSEFTSQRERAIEYEEWSTSDPFIILPFLPLNINVLPEIGQAVKVISYDTKDESLNREYIAGPFSNPHDFLSQTFTKQVENTTYGVAIKKNPDIFNKNGEYVKAESTGSLANRKDFGLYGKYGSDIVFTEDGVNIRGGKLVAKEAASQSNLSNLLSYPIMSNKTASLSLKKFPKKVTLEEREENKNVGEVKDLKYLVEYELNSLSNPTKIDFYVYKVLKTYGSYTKTNIFNEFTILPASTLKLINIDNSATTPTHSIDITDVNSIHIEINNFIYVLHDESLKEINSLYEEDDLHPFYYRAGAVLSNLQPANPTEQTFKSTLLSKVLPYRSLTPQNSLIWSKSKISPEVKVVPKKVKYLKKDKNSTEQTFASIKSDKIYLMSTDSNESDKNINFSVLDKYELTQEDYVKNIDGNTYSMVRGENLLEILRLMLTVLFDHRHNLTKPMAKEGYDDYNKLIELIKNMENDILNKSIKIN